MKSIEQIRAENEAATAVAYLRAIAAGLGGLEMLQDPSVRYHLGVAADHVEAAASLAEAIGRHDFGKLLDEVHREAGIHSVDGFEIGGGD